MWQIKHAKHWSWTSASILLISSWHQGLCFDFELTSANWAWERGRTFCRQEEHRDIYDTFTLVVETKQGQKMLGTAAACWHIASQPWNISASVSAGSAVSDKARCSQRWWASCSPCGNAPGDQHWGKPGHGSVSGHTKTDSDLKQASYSSSHRACILEPTCPCGSTSSRCRTVAPSKPLSTYWPQAELLSLTKKSPLHVRRDSACSLPNLWLNIQSYRERKRVVFTQLNTDWSL